MNILLIDDKKDILDTMGEILEICQNHKVQGAGSGKEALKWIKKKKYDLIKNNTQNFRPYMWKPIIVYPSEKYCKC